MTKLEKLKFRIESKTGILFGTFRWTTTTEPAPVFAVALRHPRLEKRRGADDRTDWMLFEIHFGSRAFYATPRLP